MDPSLLSAIIGGVTGLITGAIASLFAPWIHWGIEKKKLRLTARRDLINMARLALETISDRKEFRESAIYSQIRPFLSESTRKIIETDRPGIIAHVAEDGEISVDIKFRQNVLSDLQVLEKEWKLL